MALLRDVKYLEQLDSSDRELPTSAANVFQQNVTYRKYLQNLDVTVALYNNVRETILDVEYPLIEQQLLDIDQQLERAITELNWTSSGQSLTKPYNYIILLQECTHSIWDRKCINSDIYSALRYMRVRMYVHKQ